MRHGDLTPTTSPDDPARAALARLTENEKACLRGRLAQEMAIDMGISPHAVEKRLKMARAKLGLSSSLAAARLLAASEGYEPSGSQAPDLAPGAAAVQQGMARPDRRPGLIPIGVALMILCVALLLLQSTPASEGRTVDERGNPVPTRKVGMDEAAAFLTDGFRQKDIDRSGHLDPREASAMEPRDGSRDPDLPSAPPAGAPDPAGGRKWMAKLDTDRDGRVSRDEYVGYMMPWTLWQGVPADWQAPSR